jgi:hypothetical protein
VLLFRKQAKLDPVLFESSHIDAHKVLWFLKAHVLTTAQSDFFSCCETGASIYIYIFILFLGLFSLIIFSFDSVFYGKFASGNVVSDEVNQRVQAQVDAFQEAMRIAGEKKRTSVET